VNPVPGVPLSQTAADLRTAWDSLGGRRSQAVPDARLSVQRGRAQPAGGIPVGMLPASDVRMPIPPVRLPHPTVKITLPPLNHLHLNPLRRIDPPHVRAGANPGLAGPDGRLYRERLSLRTQQDLRGSPLLIYGVPDS
jgi:hypothetical protein